MSPWPSQVVSLEKKQSKRRRTLDFVSSRVFWIPDHLIVQYLSSLGLDELNAVSKDEETKIIRGITFFGEILNLPRPC